MTWLGARSPLQQAPEAPTNDSCSCGMTMTTPAFRWLADAVARAAQIESGTTQRIISQWQLAAFGTKQRQLHTDEKNWKSGQINVLATEESTEEAERAAARTPPPH